MKAGKLNERVTIQAQARTPNGQGGFSTGWADVAAAPNVWARVMGLSGGESLESAVERSLMRWRVEIRQRTDVTTAHRLVWNGLNLDVKAVFPHPDAPRQTTVLLCESGLSQDGA